MSFLKWKVIFHDLYFFLVQTLHTFNKSSTSKWKFSVFPLLGLKFTKFLIPFFKQKISFFSVMRDNSYVLFQLKLYMLLAKVAQVLDLPLLALNLANSSCHFWNQEPVFLQTLHHIRHNSSVLFHLNLYALDKRSPSKCKFPDFWLLARLKIKQIS